MPTLQDALLALVDAIDVKHGNKPAKATSKPATPPKPAPKAKPAKPAAKAPRRVPVATWDCGRVAEVYGEQGAHSESREPPKYDDVFPERFFTGNYTNQPRWYPFVIHATSKK